MTAEQYADAAIELSAMATRAKALERELVGPGSQSTAATLLRNLAHTAEAKAGAMFVRQYKRTKGDTCS